MRYLDLSFPTPEENLACDEALLYGCEEGSFGESLRIWESSQPFVVVGYSNKISEEVNQNSCKFFNINVLRRISGGGTVLQGPGCLNYALILKINPQKPLESIHAVNSYVLQRHAEKLQKDFGYPIQIQGVSDLTLHNLKFSGNAQRRLQKSVLVHGTFLYDFDLSLIGKTLLMPPQQPDYRQKRPHTDFCTNLTCTAAQLQKTLRSAWEAHEEGQPPSLAEIQRLIDEKYSRQEWNSKF